MLKAFLRFSVFILLCSTTVIMHAQDESYDWWNNKHNWDGVSPWSSYLIFSPAYFGPNALPVPEIRDAMSDTNISLESSFDLHFSKGDQTQNLFLKLRYPFLEGMIAIEVFGVPIEHYALDTITRDERRARGYDCRGTAFGDLYFSTLIQVLRDKGAWPDLMLGITLRTASGDVLGDARFTDAPGYYFDLSAGKSFQLSPKFKVRPHVMMGFYVWQTNHDAWRQNDAFLYGAGVSVYSKKTEFSAKWGGYNGYIGNGDEPMVLRANAVYKLSKLHLKLAFQQGLNDFNYTSVRIGSVFLF
ncbi:MAG: hypothetical protein ABFS05_11630 [Bacteroidota bacterium]